MMMTKILKRCRSMSLAEMIADYEDILIEILLRVPARTLVRFKCVSKRWLFLISDPAFCRRHTRQNPHPSISAYFAYLSSHFDYIPVNSNRVAASERSTFSNPLNVTDSLYGGIKIMQSCNGLFLCIPQPPENGIRTTAASLIYYVLNPTTNNFCSLTPPAAAAATTIHPRIFGYALAFDPSISPHYKVVFLWRVKEPTLNRWSLDDHCRIEIFSSQTRSWRLLDSSFVIHILGFYQMGLYSNGALHWVADDLKMTYFNIDNELVGLLDGIPPQGNNGMLHSRYFWESHGRSRLHLIDIYTSCRTKFRVYEMGLDYSGWSLKYNVDLAPLSTAFPHYLPNFFAVLSLAPQENEKDEESSSLLLHVPGHVIHYNLRDNTFKSTYLTPTPKSIDDEFFLLYETNFHYVETLAPV